MEVRKVCEEELTGNAEEGAGEGWHYVRETQETLDENVTCPDHAGSTMRDFVIEEE